MPNIVTASRPEFVADIILNQGTNFDYTLPTQGGLLPNDRYMGGIWLQFEGRATNNAAGNPTGVQADAPFSLIDNIRVEGFHRRRTLREQFINVRGPDIRQYVLILTGHSPFFTPATLATGASATNDIRFIIYVPFWPISVPVRQRVNWLLDAPNYEQLQLTVRFSDDKSIFTGQTNPSTFSAFGSATGNARIRVTAEYAMGGGASRFTNFIPGRVFRTFQENSSSDLTTTANQIRLFNLIRGWRLRNLLLKTGVRSTTVSGGNAAYNTLSNTIFTNLKVFQGIGRQIRHHTDFFQMQESEAAQPYNRPPDTGYALIDWARNGIWSEALNTAGTVAGPSGDTDLFIAADVAGAANQGAVLLYEELRYLPVAA